MSALAAVAGPAATARALDQRCATCAFFRSDPHELESAIPGLRSFGSGFAAVRGDDGLCLRHDRYLSSGAHCAQYAARVTASGG
ncbi:MAG TPA: hypothetical protein VLB69_03245 [Rudaea sp.]|nr:hypothetical protein [Rudaea sp.]